MSRSRLSRLWLVLLMALLPGCKGCNRGLTSGHEKPLPNGSVILLRGTNGYGAVILRNQRMFNRVLQTPEETLEYEWFFRPDGKGPFATNDPQVLHGIVTKPTGPRWSKLIAFQEFSVEWSGNTDGLGWIYYPHDFHTFKGSSTWAMCVTDQTNATGINPGDWRWSYSTRPPLSFSREWGWLKGQLGATGR